jgi:hypothetical protein
MARLSASLLGLALVLGLSASYALAGGPPTTLIDMHQQCGGKGDSCKDMNDACVDAVWPGVRCKALDESNSSDCVKLNEWFWMCLPANSSSIDADTSSPSETVAVYGQCGGISASCNNSGNHACADAQCAEGSSCQRKDDQYWQVSLLAVQANGLFGLHRVCSLLG